MKVNFPERVDNFCFQMTREERNLYETSEKISLLDILYMIHELQKAYLMFTGALPNQVAPATDVQESAGVDLSAINSQLLTLSVQLAAKPDHYELDSPPPDSFGKNGDTVFDRTGNNTYERVGGKWQQRAGSISVTG